MLHFKCDKTCTFKKYTIHPRKCAEKKMKWKQGKIIYGGQWVSTWSHNTQSVQFQIHTFIHYELYTRLSHIRSLYKRTKNSTDRSSTLLLLSSSFSSLGSLKWGENFIAKKISKNSILKKILLHDLINACLFFIKLHPFISF